MDQDVLSGDVALTQGFYVNQVGTEADEGTDLIREAFGANYQRLVDLKRKYRPNEPVPP